MEGKQPQRWRFSKLCLALGAAGEIFVVLKRHLKIVRAGGFAPLNLPTPMMRALPSGRITLIGFCSFA